MALRRGRVAVFLTIETQSVSQSPRIKSRHRRIENRQRKSTRSKYGVLSKACARPSLSKVDWTAKAYIVSAKTSCSFQKWKRIRNWTNLAATTSANFTRSSRKSPSLPHPWIWWVTLKPASALGTVPAVSCLIRTVTVDASGLKAFQCSPIYPIIESRSPQASKVLSYLSRETHGRPKTMMT